MRNFNAKHGSALAPSPQTHAKPQTADGYKKVRNDHRQYPVPNSGAMHSAPRPQIINDDQQHEDIRKDATEIRFTGNHI
jgi:hypothetical protein